MSAKEENTQQKERTNPLGGGFSGKFPGRSPLLEQCKSFLESFKEANNQLEQQGEEADLEKLTNEETYIEMDLALGVLEEQAAANDGNLLETKTMEHEEDGNKSLEEGTVGEDALNRLKNITRKDSKKEESYTVADFLAETLVPVKTSAVAEETSLEEELKPVKTSRTRT
ncbi:hypothetical protein SJAG_01567 [Schizosaccharomyces japonicus yFS275]|uniref:Uncharacterized protein n=1 Tax=Schizosaccharomyces japonicus (strain yFS275 / FY16936) TaxID=402676 RepID=B6JYA6_SCHJY|nr:hypothetical protein SJAG_01567 [Schizosaccharomyces japonicus yFS275]EEB06524.1 hypothetical protein SJAG_01567 [Schizosaccharomyces japonicus yFS275]